jgi:L-2,4-diaminobutyrate decarboxylase
MHIEIDRSRSNRVIVVCEGRLDGTNAICFESDIGAVIEETNLPIVLDLAKVNHLTNAGVQALSHLFRYSQEIRKEHSTNQTKQLRISQMSAEVRDLLRMKGLLLEMTHAYSNRSDAKDDYHYIKALEEVRSFFLSPTSDPYKDSYFIQRINKSLTSIKKLKSSTPFWGERASLDYDSARNSYIPESLSTLDETIDSLTDYLKGNLNWGHPKVQKNVLPPATIASIMGQMIGSIANANLISDEYSHRIAEAELEAISMCTNLIGYNQNQAGGFFTFGGTGANLYAIRIGSEKALPGSFRGGIRQDAKVICSDVAHYSNFTALGWLGVGTKNLVIVPSDNDNSMNLKALEKELHTLLQKGEKIACIIATMGTTDAFGIDNLDSVVKLRDELVKQYQLPYKPHIHADAAIGWIFTIFKDYDFDNNPMGFTSRTVQSLVDTSSKLIGLNKADSVSLDFHKMGYSPYTSSMFICRDHTELSLIARDVKEMPYLFHDGHYHPGRFTLETSRSGSSALLALSNLKLLGKEGYRTILGHTVTMAGKLRSRIERSSYACVVNDYNYGPVTLFRIYPNNVDAKLAYRQETTNPELVDQLRIHNDYNCYLFSILQQQLADGYGLALSLTKRYRTSSYGEPIVAIKSYIMSPFVDAEVMEKLFSCLEEARTAI